MRAWPPEPRRKHCNVHEATLPVYCPQTTSWIWKTFSSKLAQVPVWSGQADPGTRNTGRLHCWFMVTSMQRKWNIIAANVSVVGNVILESCLQSDWNVMPVQERWVEKCNSSCFKNLKTRTRMTTIKMINLALIHVVLSQTQEVLVRGNKLG